MADCDLKNNNHPYRVIIYHISRILKGWQTSDPKFGKATNSPLGLCCANESKIKNIINIHRNSINRIYFSEK